MIEQAQSEAIELLESENWKKEAGVDEIEGIVYTKTTKTHGKVFKLVVRVRPYVSHRMINSGYL